MEPAHRLVEPHYPAPQEAPLVMAEQKSPDALFFELLRQVWRRKGLIMAAVMTIMFMVALVVFQITPLYTAQTVLTIDVRGYKVVEMENVVAGLPADIETINSEVEIIRSRNLAQRVIEKLNLHRVPELNPALRRRSATGLLLDPWRLLPREWLIPILGLPLDELEVDNIAESEDVEDLQTRLVDGFIKRLKVSPKGRSRAIVIEYTSSDPKVAAAVANNIATLYIRDQRSHKLAATKRATAWLDKRVVVMRQQVKVSERAIEAYRRRSGLITDKGKSIASQQVADLSTQVILAKTARAEAVARLRQAETLLKSPGGAASSAEVRGSQLIQRLREQEAEIDRHAAELSEEYGFRHPKIIKIKAEKRDLAAKIRSEVAKIVKGLRNEVEIAGTREAALGNNLKRLESRVARANNSEVKLRALEREAKANRDLLETFLARFGETRAQEDMDAQEPDARVISRAAVPAEPSFPRRGIIFILAFAGSSIIGISLALVIDLIGRGFQNSEQLEQATGLPVYTLIPILDRKWMGDVVSSPEDYIVESPGSAFGESMRSLHTSILLSRLDEPPKTALVTSAFPEEGKTTIVICLARLLATTGRSVLILDCDLRMPLVGETVGLPGALPGLIELLTGNASYEDVIVKDPSSNAFILPAGSGGAAVRAKSCLRRPSTSA